MNENVIKQIQETLRYVHNGVAQTGNADQDRALTKVVNALEDALIWAKFGRDYAQTFGVTTMKKTA